MSILLIFTKSTHEEEKKGRTPYKLFLILQLLMFQQNKDLAVKGLMGNRIKVATDFNQNAFFKARKCSK